MVTAANLENGLVSRLAHLFPTFSHVMSEIDGRFPCNLETEVVSRLAATDLIHILLHLELKLIFRTYAILDGMNGCITGTVG